MVAPLPNGPTGTQLRVVTRCATIEEFFAMFRPFVDENSLFIPTRNPRPVGTRQAFLIQLRDGQVMLRGQGEVVESFPEAASPQRVGMRMHILSLDRSSQDTLARLLEIKRAPTLPPPFRAASTSQTMRFLIPPIPPAQGPPAETRVPGASYTLPANPFSELPSEALEHFIDCTIYEDTSAPSVSPSAGPVVASASRPKSDGTERVEPLSAPQPLPQRKRNMAAVLAVSIGAAIVGLVGGWMLWGQPSPPAQRPGSPAPKTETPPAVVEPNPAPKPDPTPVAAVAAVPAPEEPALTAQPEEPTPEKPEEPKPEEPIAAVVPLPIPAPAQPVPVPVPPPQATDCVASFDTEPDGADVTVNGAAVGKTPLPQTPIPCGPVTIAIAHPRYERVEKTLEATAGEPVAIKQRLARPEATLEVTSTPAGATVMVHGENIGRAPARVKLDSFTSYKLTATLEGHKIWSQNVYVKGRRMSVAAKMEPMEAGKGRWRPGPSAAKR